MNKEQRLLELVKSKIEETFPGTIAEYEDFAEPRHDPDDGYLKLEIFNVNEDDLDAFDEFSFKLRQEIVWPAGFSIAFFPWTIEESEKYYKADLEYLTAKRAGENKQSFFRVTNTSSLGWQLVNPGTDYLFANSLNEVYSQIDSLFMEMKGNMNKNIIVDKTTVYEAKSQRESVDIDNDLEIAA